MFFDFAAAATIGAVTMFAALFVVGWVMSAREDGEAVAVLACISNNLLVENEEATRFIFFDDEVCRFYVGVNPDMDVDAGADFFRYESFDKAYSHFLTGECLDPVTF